MAKVVSTKFGDRRLVNLPPVDLHGAKTPVVTTIEPSNPLFVDRTVPSPRAIRRRDDVAGPRVVPKEYSYRDQQPYNLQFGQLPRKGGNLVDAQFQHMEDMLVDQLTQRHNVPAFQGYPMVPVAGQEQLVVPQKYMEYTPHAIQTMAPNNPQQTEPPPVGPIQPAPPQQQSPYPDVPYFGRDPKEKHIFYGPNGEVLPGRPPWHKGGHIGARHGRLDLEDFDIQGTLIRGKLTTVRLSDNSGSFPRIPEYLTRDLMEKYHQHERTEVRIIAKAGQINVHATPQIKGAQTDQFAPLMPVPVNSGPIVQYMPIYIDDDGNVIDNGDIRGSYGPDHFHAGLNNRFPANRFPARRNYEVAPQTRQYDRKWDEYAPRGHEPRDRFPIPNRANNTPIAATPVFPPDRTQTALFTTQGRRPLTDDPMDDYRWRQGDSRYDTRRPIERRPPAARYDDRLSTGDVRPAERPETRPLRF